MKNARAFENANDTKPYKVVEIYLKEGDANESNSKNQ